jgi:hypothetical protein
VIGVCATTHYNCTTPAASTSHVDGTTAWTWICPGSNGGANSPQCSELKPDLTAAAPTPNAAILSTEQTFNATISNAHSPTGSGFSNFFQVTNTVNYNPDVSSPDLTKIDDKPPTPMAALAAGASATTTTTHIFSSIGTYYIRACADKKDRNTSHLVIPRTDSVYESDEDHNCSAWTPVTVTNNAQDADC